MQSLHQRLDEALLQLPAVTRFCVAFSGGIDSFVLLHALKQHYPHRVIHAIHINHQLQADAGEWQRHCQVVCDELSIELQFEVIEVDQHNGESLEACARELRYQAFARHIKESDCLLTAHHQDDQAETLLLQLLRGAGPHGLAAMPVLARFGKGYHARPLLRVTREEIRAYAQAHGLRWIEDGSNRDTRFDRNFLRHEVMPRIKQRWPQAAATVSRSAQLCADAAQQLDARAQQWLSQVGVTSHERLPLPELQQLNDNDCRNVLRYWLHQSGWSLPSFVHLQALVQQVIRARSDAEPLLKWGQVEVRRFNGELYVMNALARHDNNRIYNWNENSSSLPAEVYLPSLQLEDIGMLKAQTGNGGVDRQRLEQGRLQVRFRQGGESCHQSGHNHTQSLKKLMQQWRIPPWQRDRIPLIYNADELVCVVGYCITEGYRAGADEPGVLFRLEDTR